MEVKLTVIRLNDHFPEKRMTYRFQEKGGTIGCETVNDWVLPDIHRFLSGQHAVVEYRNDDFWIRDTSKNGVFINHSKMPIGKGNAACLQTGDQLRMGRYVVEVSMDSGTSVVIDEGVAERIFVPPLVIVGDERKETNKGEVKDPFDFLKSREKDIINMDHPQQKSPDVESRAILILGSEQNADSERNDTIAKIIKGKKSLQTDSGDIVPASVSDQEGKQVEPDMSPGYRDAMCEFLGGAGIQNGDKLAAITETSDMRALGKLFRLTIQGTLDALHSRTEIKSSMRMDMTAAQSNKNNPLKFAITVDEALQHILLPLSDVYQPPAYALQEAYDDIREHQMAMVAGIQAALRLIFRRFDPVPLAKRLEKNNPIMANIPIQRQAKLWQLFEELYTTLEEECQDDFQRLFGLEFARAYEAQILQFKKEQKS